MGERAPAPTDRPEPLRCLNARGPCGDFEYFWQDEGQGLFLKCPACKVPGVDWGAVMVALCCF